MRLISKESNYEVMFHVLWVAHTKAQLIQDKLRLLQKRYLAWVVMKYHLETPLESALQAKEYPEYIGHFTGIF